MVPVREKEDSEAGFKAKRFDQFGPLLLWTLSIHQRVSQRNLFSLEADHFHPLKRVANIAMVGAVEFE